MSQMSWDIALCVPVLRTGTSHPRMGLSRPNINTAHICIAKCVRRWRKEYISDVNVLGR